MAKFLFECPRYYPTKGGIQMSMYNLAKSLTKKGHEIHVICRNYPKNLDKYNKMKELEGVKLTFFQDNGVPSIFEFLRYFKRRKSFKNALKKLIEKEKFDIVISRFSYFVEPTKELIPNIPIIYWHPSILYIAFKKYSENTNRLIEKINFALISLHTFLIEKKADKLADKVLVRSNVMKKIITSKFKTDQKKIDILNQGVDLTKFKEKTKNADLIKKFNLKDKKVILTVSRLKPDKNNSGLIKIFSKIKDKNSVLMIVGGGVGKGMERKYLETLAKKLNIGDRVIFTGEQEDTEKFYNLADIFVLASEQEGFPNVYLEAMASGVPIIGFHSNLPKITVPTEEICKNNSGFAVKDGDEMTKKIDFLLKNNKVRNMMGKSARKEAEKYNWDNSYENLMRLLRKWDYI
jgi:glycosyltransferase involved in cell wall biosynthesis